MKLTPMPLLHQPSLTLSGIKGRTDMNLAPSTRGALLSLESHSPLLELIGHYSVPREPRLSPQQCG
jgi:hypothetical protein